MPYHELPGAYLSAVIEDTVSSGAGSSNSSGQHATLSSELMGNQQSVLNRC
jgi:hypothetical protein